MPRGRVEARKSTRRTATGTHKIPSHLGLLCGEGLRVDRGLVDSSRAPFTLPSRTTFMNVVRPREVSRFRHPISSVSFFAHALRYAATHGSLSRYPSGLITPVYHRQRHRSHRDCPPSRFFSFARARRRGISLFYYLAPELMASH